MKHLLPLFLLTMLFGCIGTDFIDDPTFDEIVFITPRVDEVMKDSVVQFSASYFNVYGQEVDTPIVWNTSNAGIFSLTPTGLGTCLDTGAVYITASVGMATDTLFLNTTGVTNTNNQRTGMFVDGTGSYKASGDVMVTLNDNGGATITLANNFSSSSGPGVYMFLGKNTTGPFNYTPGSQDITNISLQATPNRLTNFDGTMTFSIPDGSNAQDYDFVVLWCVTINGLFGYAELN